MAPHSEPLLVDTNVIVECHRVGAWRALTSRYRTQTVEKCVEETQTGFQNRNPEQQIDEKLLRGSLAAVYAVTELEIAKAVIRESLIGTIDPGEKHLWAHALERTEAWILCGPDKASLKIGVRLGLRERLVSLERLLGDIGHRSNPSLKGWYTEKWHAETLNGFVVSGAGGKR